MGRYEAGLTAKLVHLVEVAPVGIERVVALRTLDNKGCVRNRRQGECLKAVAAGLRPIASKETGGFFDSARVSKDVSFASWRLVSIFGGGSWHPTNLLCQNPQ